MCGDVAVVACTHEGEIVPAGLPRALPGEDKTLASPLLQRLKQLGYRQGTNITLDYRSAEGLHCWRSSRQQCYIGVLAAIGAMPSI